MSENQKVFISWSGDLSKAVAIALRDWLPNLFDRVAPWASDTDIEAGQRGLAKIEGELNDTQFGIVVVTAKNQKAPWLNFEAGALGKAIGDGAIESRVVPLLVDLPSPSELTGPLAQFQAKVADKAGVLGLVKSLASVVGVPERRAVERFEKFWPELEQKVEEAKKRHGAAGPKQRKRSTDDVLDEILTHVRSLRSTREAATEPRRQSIRGYIEEVARQNGLTLSEVSVAKGGARRVVAELAKGREYSREAEDAFTAAVEQRFGDGVEVTVIPF